ncbi:unnamed protein product [Caretta caretta]
MNDPVALHCRACALSAISRVGGPTITPSQKVYAEGSALNLLRRDHPSPALVYIWLFNELQVSSSGSGSELQVTNLCVSHSGNYTCVAITVFPLSSRNATLEIQVQEGPDSARIDPPGPIGLTLGSPLTLTCLADSVPAPSYHWFLNGTDTNETESILTVNPTSLDQLGTYKCQAHNSVTGLTARMDIEVEGE